MNKGSKRKFFDTIKDYQGLIISTFIVVVVLWLTSNFLLPNIDKIRQSLDAQKDQDKKIALLQQKYTVLANLDKNEELGVLKKITTVLPEEKDVFSIFSGLDDLEKNSGVVITNSAFRIGVVSTGSAALKSSANQKANYQPIDINFEVIGTRDQIISLMQNLTIFKTRLFTARDVMITIVDDSHIDASFLMTTYFSPFPSSLGSADTPLPKTNSALDNLRARIAQNASLPTEEVPNLPQGKNNLFSQ